jgi:hypothetical protein
MANFKLILDDDFGEDYSLVAIHCSSEAYKMAYMLNDHLVLQLQRKRLDLDFSNDGLEVTFPLFHFENTFQYTQYHLVANKCMSVLAHTMSTGGLFVSETSEKMVATYLLSEFKNVDYFLKIESDFEKIPLRKLVTSINEIKEVISAYTIPSETIKSKNHLIFD